jgi:glyoxylase-like metal-dependent hydrolase (beta-lactamase superfamily II)
MILETSSFGPFETNVYIVGCFKTKKACIIDAPAGCVPFVMERVKKHGLTVTHLLFTHAHIDHIADASKLKDSFSVPLLIHTLDAPGLLHPWGKEMHSAFQSAEGMEADQLLEEGDHISIGELFFHVLFTPGHSPGCVCFYEKERNTLFSGDTLFKGCMGRVDLPGSSPSSMWKSLKKLSTLPSSTRVFPGHGSETTIGDEDWMENAESIFSGGNDS